LILLRRFDAEAALSSIETHQVTMFEGVPTMYFRILAQSRLKFHDIRSLVRCTVGGQSIPLEKIAEVERVFGCPLVELWGMTELGGPAITPPTQAKFRRQAQLAAQCREWRSA
jgi:long-chain acyl-CoA synthetase